MAIAKPRAVPEWRLQAAAVKWLKHAPGYGTLFTIAGDMNAGKRSPQQRVVAQATGMMPGEPDLRVYLAGGRLGLIEFKGARTAVSAEQRARHALLAALGFEVVTCRASTEDEAADKAGDIVAGWMAAGNDNRACHYSAKAV